MLGIQGKIRNMRWNMLRGRAKPVATQDDPAAHTSLESRLEPVGGNFLTIKSGEGVRSMANASPEQLAIYQADLALINAKVQERTAKPETTPCPNIRPQDREALNAADLLADKWLEEPIVQEVVATLERAGWMQAAVLIKTKGSRDAANLASLALADREHKHIPLTVEQVAHWPDALPGLENYTHKGS